MTPKPRSQYERTSRNTWQKQGLSSPNMGAGMSKLALKYLETRDLRNLKESRRGVLRAIAFYVYDRNGCAAPGWKRLTERCEITKRTLSRVLNDLEHVGMIARKRRGSVKYKHRLKDQIELVGFLSWKRNQAPLRRYTYDRTLSDNQTSPMGTKRYPLGTICPHHKEERDLERGARGQSYSCHDSDWQSLAALSNWEPIGEGN